MTGGYGAIFWLIVAVALFIVESVTIQLVCIWFAFGAVFSMFASFIGAPFWLQLVVFLVSSIAVLVVGRPLLLDRIKPRIERTNVDRVIGQVVVVKEDIDNVQQTGRVYATGLDWTARSYTGDPINAGSKVIVKQIDGVKLIVERLYEEEA